MRYNVQKQIKQLQTEYRVLYKTEPTLTGYLRTFFDTYNGDDYILQSVTTNTTNLEDIGSNKRQIIKTVKDPCDTQL